ncbi:MAG: 6-phosphogluconolactonase, partial [Burkholderiales bacterium]|nr:6-phosphogluconolactonase [Burkholderiales bacterium]
QTYCFRSQNEQITEFINKLQAQIQAQLKHKDEIVIAFSGGKSPIALFEQLGNTELAWNKITITLVDERIVDNDSSESNEHLIKTYLLKNKAKDAQFIGLVDMRLSNTQMVDIANKNLPNIDIAILGMGEDGHTASIFSDCKELYQAIDLTTNNRYINTNPISAEYSRITLTLKAICDIPLVYIMINGGLKLKVLNEALKGNNTNYPISYVLNMRGDLITFWYE